MLCMNGTICCLYLIITWFSKGIKSCRSLGSLLCFKKCSMLGGTYSNTSLSMQIIILCRNCLTPACIRLLWLFMPMAWVKILKISKKMSVQSQSLTLMALEKPLDTLVAMDMAMFRLLANMSFSFWSLVSTYLFISSINELMMGESRFFMSWAFIFGSSCEVTISKLTVSYKNNCSSDDRSFCSCSNIGMGVFGGDCKGDQMTIKSWMAFRIFSTKFPK
ncbi:hypothetical protein BpHYR1_036118 [Brachionus plicatilis]|uniref:Uncharacterized protein n=1 Tax=Brachionus plicatilis TaxID=10195 RepID=A0A3M7S5X4_BRAPC|nr:hypothetical protein BpHYR1_036118 [Brachionus plicatilis]